MLPTKFRFIWPNGVRGEDFQKSTNQKQELPVVTMFVNGSGRNEQSLQRTCHRCFLPSFGSFGQAVSEEKNLKNQTIRNKRRLWRPCLLTDWDEMSYLYRGPSIDAYHQVSVHLAKCFQRRFFKNQQKLYRDNCILNADICIQNRVIFLLTEEKIFLEINQSETRIACGGHVC